MGRGLSSFCSCIVATGNHQKGVLIRDSDKVKQVVAQVALLGFELFLYFYLAKAKWQIFFVLFFYTVKVFSLVLMVVR